MAVNWGGVAGMIVFYLIILVVGLWASRKAKQRNNSEVVMVGGRDFGWVVGFFTLVATWVGGGYINGTAEVVFKESKGLVWAQAPLGYSLSFFINGIFFAEKMRAANYVTMIDPFQVKYGNRMGGFLFLAALMGELLWCAAILAALGSTIAVIIDIDQHLAVIISACIAAVYTVFGGLYSVAYTDIVQLCLIVFGLWLCLPFALTNDAVTPLNETKERWLGHLSPNKVGVWLDYIMQLLCGGVPWQVYYQRALSTKTPKQAKYTSFMAAFGCLVLSVPAYLMGAVGASTDWNMTSINLNTTDPYEQPNIILPAVIQYLTPPFVAFLGLGAISAAVMSSTDSSVLSTSSMWTRNVYRNILRPKASEKELVWLMRISVIVVTTIATIMALTVSSIYALFVLCSDFVYVILFPQLVCVIHVNKSNTYGSAVAFVVGLFLRLASGVSALSLPPLIRYPLYDEEYGQQFPFRTLCMIISLLTLLLVSYATAFVFEKEYLSNRWDVFKCFGKSSPDKNYDTINHADQELDEFQNEKL
ncbi:high-affinity choline transporter 1-like [Diadema antillarum]|uniref:high-affinity choline transporter 1-like n=1 Tax=Diadema antillarum TaxID=105358 RepID=UPI003A852D02